MSDAAVASIITGLVTITTLVIGFLTMWVKLKYGIEKTNEAAGNLKVVEGKVDDAATKAKAVEKKLDNNTVITAKAKDAADKVVEHAIVCDEERTAVLKVIGEHDKRISALESQMTALKLSVDTVTKNVDSSRHEMRGHLQTVTSKLDMIAMQIRQPVPPAVAVVMPTPTPVTPTTTTEES